LARRIEALQRELVEQTEVAGDGLPAFAIEYVGDSKEEQIIRGRKAFVRRHCPQAYDDFLRDENNPSVEYEKANTVSEADSSELLYYFLTRGTSIGNELAASDAFNTAELGDTDNDGLREILDAWGNPLRFYRWPTRLIRPAPSGSEGTAGIYPINLGAGATLLIGSLRADHDVWAPSKPYAVGDFVVSGTDNERVYRCVDATGSSGGTAPAWANTLAVADTITDGGVTWEVEMDPAAADGDDPLGVTSGSGFDAVTFESSFHSAATSHTPLIISAGEDGELGLYEPQDVSNFGNLAQPKSGERENLLDNVSSLNLPTGAN